jgi:hypothetical protein
MTDRFSCVVQAPSPVFYRLILPPTEGHCPTKKRSRSYEAQLNGLRSYEAEMIGLRSYEAVVNGLPGTY